MLKKNCWEVKRCGREAGGTNTSDLGVCPASVEEKADGINEGRNAGRSCWAVSGTFCEGKVDGTFSAKVTSCLLCDFYKRVCREQGEFFQGTAFILNELKKKK